MSRTTDERPAQGSDAGGDAAPASYGVSYSEQFLWSMEQSPDQQVAFLECPSILSLVVRIEPHLDVSALQRSLREIVRRHAVLRSTFRERDGRPIRVVDAVPRIALPVIDVRHLSERLRVRAAHHLLARVVGEPFDIAMGPLLRAMVVHVRDGEYGFALAVHHLVFDAGSWPVLMRELHALYGEYACGWSSSLPALAADYAQYVAWQRARLDGGPLTRLTDAWLTRLAGAIPPPADRSRIDRRSGRAGTHPFTIASGHVEGLRLLSRRAAVTPAITLLALFAVMLHGIGDATDVLVGVPMSDRRRREFETLIGLFTNVLVLRLDLSGNPAFLDVLGRARGALEEAYAQQDVPYGHGVRALAAVRGTAPVAPFRATFNFMSAAADARLRLPGLTVEPLPIGNRPRAFADVNLQVRDRGQMLDCTLLYSADLFSADDARRLAEEFVALIVRVLEQPTRSLGDAASGFCRAATSRSGGETVGPR